MSVTIVHYLGDPDDVGIVADDQVFWHDGHIDPKHEHIRSDGGLPYVAAPLDSLEPRQLQSADRALYVYREAKEGRFYTLTGSRLLPLSEGQGQPPDTGCLDCAHRAVGHRLGFCNQYAVSDYDQEEAGNERDEQATDESIELGRKIRDWLDQRTTYEQPGCPGREPR